MLNVFYIVLQLPIRNVSQICLYHKFVIDTLVTLKLLRYVVYFFPFHVAGIIGKVFFAFFERLTYFFSSSLLLDELNTFCSKLSSLISNQM